MVKFKKIKIIVDPEEHLTHCLGEHVTITIHIVEWSSIVIINNKLYVNQSENNKLSYTAATTNRTYESDLPGPK